MITVLNDLQASPKLVSLTGAAADYPLDVGDTAVLSFSAATSVPLRVATVPGIYKLYLFGDTASAATNTNANAQLQMNGTTYTGEVYYYIGGSSSYNTILLPVGRLNTVELVICTITAQKGAKYLGSYRDTGNNIVDYNGSFDWRNASTAWTSLGTLTLPFAQTGTILVQRLV